MKGDMASAVLGIAEKPAEDSVAYFYLLKLQFLKPLQTGF